MGYTAYNGHMAYPFVAAKHFTRTDGRKIDLVVLHSMEAPEKGDTAEAVANYFARGTVVASAHYNVDSDSIVQCVRDQDVAYHAPGKNHDGIGIEHAGYARQSAEEWADPYSQAMLVRSAALTAELCAKYGIPPTYVGPAGLLNGARGITTHAAVSQAFRKSTHTDPGGAFPMGQYLVRVRNHLSPPKEIAPMYDPPLGPIAAVWQDGAGNVIAAVSPDGAVYAWGCAYVGGMNGDPNFVGRRAARIGPSPVPGKVYVITATSGETYHLPK